MGNFFRIESQLTQCESCAPILPDLPPPPRPLRDFGPRADRQQSRLIWLIEQMGVEVWKAKIEEYMGGVKLRPAVKVGRGGGEGGRRRGIPGLHPNRIRGFETNNRLSVDHRRSTRAIGSGAT